MPGLNCNFRIQEVQECDSLIDPFDSDDADDDGSIYDDPSVEDSDYTSNTFDFGDSSEESESSEENESSDDQSEQADDKKTDERSIQNADFVAQELCKMDTAQSELAQNLIAAILHEGVMGRLTPNTMLKDLSPDDSDSTPDAMNSSN